MEVARKVALVFLLMIFFPSMATAFPVVTSKVGSSLKSRSTWLSHTSSKPIVTYTNGFAKTVSGKSDKQRNAEDVAAMVREGFSKEYALKFVNKSDYYTNNRGGLSFVNYSNSKAAQTKAYYPPGKSSYTFVDPVKNPGIKITGGSVSKNILAIPGNELHNNNEKVASGSNPVIDKSVTVPGEGNSSVDNPSYQQEQEAVWNISIVPEGNLHVTDHFDPDGENFIIRIECSIPFNKISLEFCGYSQDFDGRGRLIISRDIDPVNFTEFIQNVHYRWPVNDAAVTVCAWTIDGDMNYSRIFVDVNAFNPYLKE
ncbi:MAG: hypothetical protein M1371_11660 [Actinobacteria bacterium]|nr:hypothetical protein [Actinomycetota bacterium]